MAAATAAVAAAASAFRKPISRPSSSSSSSSSIPTAASIPSLPRPFSPFSITGSRSNPCVAMAKTSSSDSTSHSASAKKRVAAKEEAVAEEEEVEEDLPWIQEKALDVVEFTGSVTQAIPGPRVGRTSLPLLLAIPLAYAGLTLAIALVKTLRKFNSPKEKRRKLVNKNAVLCKSIDALLEKGEVALLQPALKQLMQKTGFYMEEILRKYIRYALNEKPFNPVLVESLIQLRKATSLDDSQVSEILNEISRRIVRDKGPVVMDMSGYSEKGFKRKLAVQTLFGKMFYLSELPEFCSRDSSLKVKEIFGVTDEDAEKLRVPTLSEAGDMDSLEKMVGNSDTEESNQS